MMVSAGPPNGSLGLSGLFDDQTVDLKKDHGDRRDADRPDGHYGYSVHDIGDSGQRPPRRTDQSYIPAYGHLARTNIRSVERAIELRRMIIEKIRSPSSEGRLAAIRGAFDAKGAEFEQEAQAAQALIKGLIEKGRSSATLLSLPGLRASLIQRWTILAAILTMRSRAWCHSRCRRCQADCRWPLAR